MTTPVAFESFEHQKENILPLREGRSAAALQRVFSDTTPHSAETRDITRSQFEQALSEEILSELDDPLEPFLQYIQWTLETYPSGHSTTSGLVPLLERTTQYFRRAVYYRDDPRYLGVWMRYVALSDSPREMFTYLAQNQIGAHLATFYERYAAYFEATGRDHQAQEVFEWGISMGARPLVRLERRFQEFKARMLARGGENNNLPHSPVRPVVRPVLGVKSEIIPTTTITAPTPTPTVLEIAATTKSKMSVFTDTDPTPTPISAITPGGWDTIGSLASRRKENAIEPMPWVGQTMPQNTASGNGNTKIAVFRDTESVIPPPPHPHSHPTSKPSETIAIKMELLYDKQNNEEFCLEEILAKARRLYKLQLPKKVNHTSHHISTATPKTGSKRTIPLDDHSPIRPRPASPTMTMHSKKATEEVFDMFNQPLEDAGDDDDDDDDDEEEEERHYEMTGYGSDFTMQ